MEEIPKVICTCIFWRESSVLPISIVFLTSSKRNNKLVWDASVDIVQGLVEDVWAGQDVITVDHCLDITLPVGYDPLPIPTLPPWWLTFNLPDCPIRHRSGWWDPFRSFKRQTHDADLHAKVLEGTFHGRKMPLFRQAMPWLSKILFISWRPISFSSSSFLIKQWFSQKGCKEQKGLLRNCVYVLTDIRR